MSIGSSNVFTRKPSRLRDLLRMWVSIEVRKVLRDLLKEYRVNRLHRKGVRRARRLTGQRNLKLHLGCGPVIKAGWVNIDLQPKADLTLDLRQSLPFADNSCAVIYAEHFLEHLDYPGPALQFLRETHRVLQSHGVLSLAVPDVEWAIEICRREATPEWFDCARKNWAYPEWCVTKMEFLNYLFRQRGQHRFAYDFETLRRVVSQAGFIDIAKREFDVELDSEGRRLGSLFLIATKPQPAEKVRSNSC